jgi:CRP-like cAMP-binding protein
MSSPHRDQSLPQCLLPDPPANRLLAAMPPDAYERLRPELEPVALQQGQVLYDPSEPIAHVHFPTTAVVSLLTLLQDGTSVETAMVGNWGMVGLPLALGLDADTNRALVQVGGEALRLPAPAFRAALGRDGALRNLLHRCTQVVLVQMAQSAACNRLHTMNACCARWLLEAQDGVGADEFPLTHDFLAAILAVRRATVTVVAETLQQAGLIRYHRGLVTILDRERLEAAACECYRTIADAIERLLGGPDSAGR